MELKYPVKFTHNNEELYLYKGNYNNNGSPAILIVDKDLEPYCDLTVNIMGRGMESQWLDVNNCPLEIIKLFETDKLIINTGTTQQSGFVEYPLYYIKDLLDKIPTYEELEKALDNSKKLDVSDIKNSVSKETKIKKWLNLKVIQGNYGTGFEDLTCYDAEKEYEEFRNDLKAYKENDSGDIRSIERKVINPKWFDKEYPELAKLGTGQKDYYDIVQLDVRTDDRLKEVVKNLTERKNFLDKQNKNER